MSLFNKIAQYKAYKNGVVHCTFNPEGPGAVRIHLVPPKFRLIGNSPYIVILNGYYLLPIGYSWAVILSGFMAEVNKFDSRSISADDEKVIYNNTVKRVLSVYPSMTAAAVREDLDEMLRVIFAVARGASPHMEIEKLSIREYRDNMTAPHRMDLMVSAMTNSEGRWNCNQKCKFCYAADQHKSCVVELSTEEWKKALDNLYDAHIPMVTFTGGEPTLREDIDVLVKYAKRFVTRLNTNGIELTENLCTRLKAASLDSVQVTLYSHDENVHNELVGASRFTDTVNGIKNAVAAGLDISINTPLCKMNSDYIRTLEFIKELGVSFVTASGLICTGMADINHEEYDLTEDELYDIIKSAKEYCNDNNMEIDFTSPGLISKDKLEAINMNVPMCGAALSNMAVAPDGTVVPCQSWLGEDSALGNILTDRFSNIWNHTKCKKLRNMTEEEALACPFREGGVS